MRLSVFRLILQVMHRRSSAGSTTHVGRTFSSCSPILYDVGIGICILPNILPNGLLSTAVKTDVNTLVTNTLSTPLDSKFVDSVARSIFFTSFQSVMGGHFAPPSLLESETLALTLS